MGILNLAIHDGDIDIHTLLVFEMKYYRYLFACSQLHDHIRHKLMNVLSLELA